MNAPSSSMRAILDARTQDPGRMENPHVVRDVRAELARLWPSPLGQHLLTLFTGKALPAQRPLFRQSPASLLVCTLLVFVGSLAASAWLLGRPWPYWLALPLPLLLTTGAARTLMITILHHIVHRNFVARARLERLLFESIAVPLLQLDFDSYHDLHVRGHHGPRVARTDDPEAYVLALGFAPGTPVGALWRRLWLTMASPRFHLCMVVERLAACFWRPAGRLRRGGAAAFHVTVFAAAVWNDALTLYGVAYLLPVLPLFHISSLLQVCTEHRWFLQAEPNVGRRARLGRLTFGRFSGEAPPSRGEGRRAWCGFWMRMLLIHLPTRLCVWVSDMPQHDAHHRHPSSFDWANAAFARQADIDAGCPGWPEGYTEIWGLSDALAESFRAISEPPERRLLA